MYTQSINPSKSMTTDNPAFKGIRRARYSFHFTTHRVRRWLLVQWVSMPVALSTNDEAVEPPFRPKTAPTAEEVWRSIETNRLSAPAARLY